MDSKHNCCTLDTHQCILQTLHFKNIPSHMFSSTYKCRKSRYMKGLLFVSIMAGFWLLIFHCIYVSGLLAKWIVLDFILWELKCCQDYIRWCLKNTTTIVAYVHQKCHLCSSYTLLSQNHLYLSVNASGSKKWCNRCKGLIGRGMYVWFWIAHTNSNK